MIVALSVALLTMLILYVRLDNKFSKFLKEATEREVVHGRYLDEYTVLLDKWKAVQDKEFVKQEIAKNPVLTGVISKFYAQTEKGLQKYGNTVNPDEYTEEEWLLHFQQEMIDGAVYVEALIQKRSEE